MEKNIMLAFVSTVNPKSLENPVEYKDIQGAPYTAIQTNESAIVYVERMLGENSVAQIFLIASSFVKNGKIPKIEKPKPSPIPEPVELSGFEKFKRWLAKKFGFSEPVKVPAPVVEAEPAVTHLEFLKARLVKEFPHFEGRFVEIDYSEGADSLEKNIQQIAEIADAVTDYAKNFPASKIRVHADMTGGFRHASMLMLSIIQLLQYRGVEVGKILYSDPASKIVYEANEIQRVSLLITGADEFVKFGSVNALQEYFAGNTSAAASDLLRAMNRFSDAIKICRTGTIVEDLENLGAHIAKFRATGKKDLQSELFAKILDRVEAEYGDLIKGGATRFEIIRWCMRKGFWQQAMTLCTEWLPEEIVDRGIFKPGNSVVQDLAEADGASFGRGWKQHFIIAYSKSKLPEVADDSPNEADIEAFCKNLRKVLVLYISGDVSDLLAGNYYGELKEFLGEFEAGAADFEACCEGELKLKIFKERYPRFHKALQGLLDERKKNLNYNKNFYQFMKSLGYDKVIDNLSKLPQEALLEVFSVDREKIPREEKISGAGEKSERKWSNREKIYVDMLDNKVAKSDLNDRRRALEILHGFYDLRSKRNEINHATGTSEIAALRAMIENYIGKLEKI